MRKKSFYPMMALQNIVKNRRFFVPYLLTITGTSAAFYIMCALCTDPGAQELEGYEYVQSMMMLSHEAAEAGAGPLQHLRYGQGPHRPDPLL